MKDYKFEFMHITDVCLLLGLKPIEVLKLCKEGKINATPKKNSIHYNIPAEQFKNQPNWNEFLKKREERRQKSIKLAETMLEILDEDEA